MIVHTIAWAFWSTAIVLPANLSKFPTQIETENHYHIAHETFREIHLTASVYPSEYCWREALNRQRRICAAWSHLRCAHTAQIHYGGHNLCYHLYHVQKAIGSDAYATGQMPDPAGGLRVPTRSHHDH